MFRAFSVWDCGLVEHPRIACCSCGETSLKKVHSGSGIGGNLNMK